MDPSEPVLAALPPTEALTEVTLTDEAGTPAAAARAARGERVGGRGERGKARVDLGRAVFFRWRVGHQPAAMAAASVSRDGPEDAPPHAAGAYEQSILTSVEGLDSVLTLEI